MGTNLTVSQILSALQSQIELHREREAFHAQQEEMHRQERARHAAELERAMKSFEILQASTADFVALDPRDLAPGETAKLTRLVRLAVESLAPGRPFSASELTAEIDRRFGERLKKPANPRHVAVALRRMLDHGGLRLVRKGRPHTEALYAREG